MEKIVWVKNKMFTDENGGAGEAQDYTYDLDKVNTLLSRGWTVKSIHPLPAYTERENFASVAYIVLQKDD